MKTVKFLAALGPILALSILPTQLSAKPFHDKPGNHAPQKGGCCDIPDSVYRLTNPVTEDDRFEVVLDIDIPKIQVMVHDKTLDRYYILDHRPPHHRGPHRRHLSQDDDNGSGEDQIKDDGFEIAERRRGGKHRHGGCQKRPGHRPPHPPFHGPGQPPEHPSFEGKRKPPCRGTDLHLNLHEKDGTPWEISVSMDLKHNNGQLTGNMSIEINDEPHIKNASVTFINQAK
ncbi:hypothetical protein M3P05_11090 [Sansalvadorimonas sp. 2012CJ34-2]|uniref:Uncharacterized protein n=1 Tax=Parendozoicomonas callyspongiae TaxID=2942213 RepID=A0ABT0PGU7_9GAMM|nr:hypothetical protein [Sansalvadorimonas sp. 2012CJ34-2]MCL6270466.1 hypothetical protein [Sansalvadorimonas sp. 2012CJ34-2]